MQLLNVDLTVCLKPVTLLQAFTAHSGIVKFKCPNKDQ